MIEQIVMLDLKNIQVLSLGDNKISNMGFRLLFENLEWPVLVEIYLRNFFLLRMKKTTLFKTFTRYTRLIRSKLSFLVKF